MNDIPKVREIDLEMINELEKRAKKQVFFASPDALLAMLTIIFKLTRVNYKIAEKLINRESFDAFGGMPGVSSFAKRTLDALIRQGLKEEEE